MPLEQHQRVDCYGLMIQLWVGNHAICNKFTDTSLDVRCYGGVISNETEAYDTKTVALDAEVLRKPPFP